MPRPDRIISAANTAISPLGRPVTGRELFCVVRRTAVVSFFQPPWTYAAGETLGVATGGGVGGFLSRAPCAPLCGAPPGPLWCGRRRALPRRGPRARPPLAR